MFCLFLSIKPATFTHDDNKIHEYLYIYRCFHTLRPRLKLVVRKLHICGINQEFHMATFPKFRLVTIIFCFSLIWTAVMLYSTYSKLTRKPILKFNSFERSASTHSTAGILMDQSHKISSNSDKLTAQNKSYHFNETIYILKGNALTHDIG